MWICDLERTELQSQLLLQLCDLGQAIYFPQPISLIVTSWGCCESLQRESSGQSLYQNLEHVRVQSLLVFPMVTTVISLAFLWDAVAHL